MTRPARRFTIGETDFLLDGEPFRILSGALHYFRVHPDLWADRIAKAKAMGLNTIETYVPWNAHSPRPGEFRTDAGLDLARFLDEIAAQDMWAIVRPGPYICAEWDNGGLPAWLFRNGGTGVRSSEPGFLAAVEDYYGSLAPIVVPRQIDRGGPIILMQVENEYGAYGRDKEYLKALVEINRRSGVSVPLITVDQPIDDMLEDGGLPEVHKTGSFGSRVAERLEILRRHQPTGPVMCSEFWNGWFDSWGGHHHTTDVAETARNLEQLLESGASVNIYMFHGGTNFGFTNGANHKGTYMPVVTSYDYDAPLDEAGNPTPKYWAMREVIARFAPGGSTRRRTAESSPQTRDSGHGNAPQNPPRDRGGVVRARLTETASLWQIIDESGIGGWTKHETPPCTDELGHYSGFTLYRTEIADKGESILQVREVRDRAQVFLNRRSVGVMARDHHDRALVLPQDAEGVLDILVEDQGRVDYGPRIGEPKGLIGPATINRDPIAEWKVLPIDLATIDPIARMLRTSSAAIARKGATSAQHPEVIAGPSFSRAAFDVDDVQDLFLDTGNWGKGVAWINGFCLGRYWSRGPQRSLYVPAPVLRPGSNELVILELHVAATEVKFAATHDLGHTEP